MVEDALKGRTNSNARSTKTRIETVELLVLVLLHVVIPMQDPLKQGLKHEWLRAGIEHYHKIPMQDPLKQGLKQDMCEKHGLKHTHSNARSTKTRIETLSFREPIKVILLFQCKIH